MIPTPGKMNKIKGAFDKVVEWDKKLIKKCQDKWGLTDYLPEGAYVKVRLGGACSTCAMSSMTLKQGIEKKLMMEIPDVAGVIQVL